MLRRLFFLSLLAFALCWAMSLMVTDGVEPLPVVETRCDALMPAPQAALQSRPGPTAPLPACRVPAPAVKLPAPQPVQADANGIPLGSQPYRLAAYCAFPLSDTAG